MEPWCSHIYVSVYFIIYINILLNGDMSALTYLYHLLETCQFNIDLSLNGDMSALKYLYH